MLLFQIKCHHFHKQHLLCAKFVSRMLDRRSVMMAIYSKWWTQNQWNTTKSTWMLFGDITIAIRRTTSKAMMPQLQFQKMERTWFGLQSQQPHQFQQNLCFPMNLNFSFLNYLFLNNQSLVSLQLLKMIIIMIIMK